MRLAGGHGTAVTRAGGVAGRSRTAHLLCHPALEQCPPAQPCLRDDGHSQSQHRQGQQRLGDGCCRGRAAGGGNRAGRRARRCRCCRQLSGLGCQLSNGLPAQHSHTVDAEGGAAAWRGRGRLGMSQDTVWNYRSSQPGRSLGASAHEEPCHAWPPNRMHAPIARSPGRPGMSQSESNTAALPVRRPATAVSSPGVSAANQGALGQGVAATKAGAVRADPSDCKIRPSASSLYRLLPTKHQACSAPTLCQEGHQIAAKPSVALLPQAPVWEAAHAAARQQAIVARGRNQLERLEQGVVADGIRQRGCIQNEAFPVCQWRTRGRDGRAVRLAGCSTGPQPAR